MASEVIHMKIGIIGAGNIGGNLTRRLSALGHEVYVANAHGPETLKDLARETGATAVTAREAAGKGDVVVVTIPMKNVPNLPKNLFEGVREDVAVIDTCNYYPERRDGPIDDIEDGMPESQWVSRQIGRPVIKVFNNIYAEHILKFGRPKGNSRRIALPVSGDNPVAKHKVMELVDQLGFDPVDAGGLEDSWRQQPGTPVYANDYDVEGVQLALEQARKERHGEFRARKAA
jgi:predicted dinucleotide-binding enzyme